MNCIYCGFKLFNGEIGISIYRNCVTDNKKVTSKLIECGSKQFESKSTYYIGRIRLYEIYYKPINGWFCYICNKKYLSHKPQLKSIPQLLIEHKIKTKIKTKNKDKNIDKK